MIYVGIDVASDKHDCFLLTDNGEVYSDSFTINNDLEGFKKLHDAINNFVKQTKDSNVRIGLESTGHYSLNILNYFYNQKFPITLINPLLTNMDRKATTVRKTKTDKVDARGICMFLDRNRNSFKPYTPLVYHKEALKSLSRERFSLVKELAKSKIAFQRLLKIVFPEFNNCFSNIYGESPIAILYNYPTPKSLARANIDKLSSLIHAKCVITASKLKELAASSIGQSNDYRAFELKNSIITIKFFQDQIKAYEEKIKSIMDSICSPIMTIPGISYITGAIIIGEIGDINSFSSSDKLLAYCGLDPSVYQSGKFDASNTTISKRGSSILRWAIHQSSNIIWIHDKTFKEYYLKKKNEGKHHYVILGHIGKKLVRVLFSILKNNTTYSSQK